MEFYWCRYILIFKTKTKSFIFKLNIHLQHILSSPILFSFFVVFWQRCFKMTPNLRLSIRKRTPKRKKPWEGLLHVLQLVGVRSGLAVRWWWWLINVGLRLATDSGSCLWVEQIYSRFIILHALMTTQNLISPVIKWQLLQCVSSPPTTYMGWAVIDNWWFHQKIMNLHSELCMFWWQRNKSRRCHQNVQTTKWAF